MRAQLIKCFKFNYDKNIVELFKPVYILLLLTGLFPFKIEFPKGRLDTRVVQKPLPLNCFGTVLMFAFLCLYFTHRIKESMLVDNVALSSVASITLNIDLSLTFLCAIVVYFCSFRHAKTYVKILRDIAFCWADLSQVNVDCILTYLCGLFIFPAVAWLFIFPSVQASLIIIGDENVYIKVMLHSIAEVIPGSIVAFYSVMVLLVVGLLKNIEQHCPIIIGTNKRRTDDVDSGNTNSAVEIDHCIRIGQLEQAYEKAMEIKEMINNTFQAPILLIIIQCFHSILFSSHSLYRNIMMLNTISPSVVLHHSFWVVYSIAKVYALTITGSLLKGEETNIGQTLHNIPTENQDNRMLMEIQHFSTLMSFRKPIITVYDYFTLDATFLYGVIATVVTYLVILVQFDTA